MASLAFSTDASACLDTRPWEAAATASRGPAGKGSRLASVRDSDAVARATLADPAIAGAADGEPPVLSARVSGRSGALEGSDPPTAVHALAAVHETDVSATGVAPVATAAVWVDQIAPFQLSISGCAAPALVNETPVAVHALAAGQDTPSSAPPVVPVAVGVVSMLQAVPFQRSASGEMMPPALIEAPVAVQAFDALHDTAKNTLDTAFAGVGTDARLTADAPVVSTSGCITSELFVYEPTAVQLLVLHDTPLSELSSAPVGVGSGAAPHGPPVHSSESGTKPDGLPLWPRTNV